MRLDRWLWGRGCGHVERQVTEDLVGCRRGFAFTGRETGRHSKIGSTGFARLALDYKTYSVYSSDNYGGKNGIRKTSLEANTTSK